MSGGRTLRSEAEVKREVLRSMARMTVVGRDLLKWRRAFVCAQSWIVAMVWCGVEEKYVDQATLEAWLAMIEERGVEALQSLLKRTLDVYFRSVSAALARNSPDGMVRTEDAAAAIVHLAWRHLRIDGWKTYL